LINEEEPKMCTTSGRPVDVVRSEQTEKVGQHKDYIVLCPDERAKGFIRPVRQDYIHVGQSICAKGIPHSEPSFEAPKLGGNRNICLLPFEHEGECDGPFMNVSQHEHARLLQSHRRGGCGTSTHMGLALSETYARDPKFYGSTFCCMCNRHLPVAEFVWSKDGEVVGS